MKLNLILILPFMLSCSSVNQVDKAFPPSSPETIAAVDFFNDSNEAKDAGISIVKRKALLDVAEEHAMIKYPTAYKKMRKGHIELIDIKHSIPNYRVSYSRMVPDYNYINFKNPVTREVIRVELNQIGVILESSFETEKGYSNRVRDITVDDL